MTDRYTRKDAEAAFERLCFALDKPRGEWTKDAARPHALTSNEGGWTLDYNRTYGGYVIHEYVNDRGGVREPFGSQRRSARDFCDAVRFALDALHIDTTVSV